MCRAVRTILFVAAYTPLGEKLYRTTPNSLKHSITAGIGLLLTFIGLQKGKLIQHDSFTFIKLGHLGKPEALLTLTGLFVTLFLFIRQIKGSLLIGIAMITLVNLFIQPVVFSDVERLTIQPFLDTWGSLKIDPSNLRFWSATFSLTMILIFENMGLLPWCCRLFQSYQTVLSRLF